MATESEQVQSLKAKLVDCRAKNQAYRETIAQLEARLAEQDHTYIPFSPPAHPK